MRIGKFPFVVALVLLVTVVPAGAKFYTDWLWFEELGYDSVFLRSLSAQATVGIVTGFVAFALLTGNLLLALRSLRPRPFQVSTPNGPQAIMLDPAAIRPIALGVVALVSLLIANYAGSQWETWLYFLNGTAFGKTDPILGRDIGFYVFTLPLLEMIQGMLYFIIFLMVVVAVAAYVFGRRDWARRDERRVRVEARGPPPRAARGTGAGRAVVRRLAADPADADQRLRRRHRADLRRRPCPHPGALGAGGRRGGRCRAGRAICSARRTALADRRRRRPVCGRVDRRERLRVDHPASRRRSQRTGEGDALHHP